MTTTIKQWFNRWPVLFWSGILLLAGSTVAFTVQSASQDDADKAKGRQPDLVVDERPLARDLKISASFAPIVKKVGPSVVSIYTSTKVKQTALPDMPWFDHPFFRRFFGDDFNAPGQERRFYMPPRRGIGSGVLVTKDGYLLTNNHVVEEADEVNVKLQDGREYTAKVVGKDPKTDVAVLKIDAQDLPFLAMADSDQIEVGDIVLALGNPFGIGQTVTMGMVSATGRATLGLDYEDFIQTDAAINPGNSGGALVDTEGRLIGINTAILSRSGGNQGIGFAIPSNLARDVMDSLIRYGKVTRGYLGVIIQDVTPALAREFKLKEPRGALVGEVLAKGPAEKAGFKSGDVILELDGKSIRDSRQLKLEVARVKPGATVPVKVLREGASKTLTVKLQELPGTDPLARADREADKDSSTLNGVTVTDMDHRARRQYNVPDHIQGALVLQVEPDSAAAAAGLRPGDVILEINRQSVRNAADAVRLTENPKDRTTLVRVWSKGSSRYVVVDESKAG